MARRPSPAGQPRSLDSFDCREPGRCAVVVDALYNTTPAYFEFTGGSRSRASGRRWPGETAHSRNRYRDRVTRHWRSRRTLVGRSGVGIFLCCGDMRGMPGVCPRRIAAWRRKTGQIRTVSFRQAVSFRQNTGRHRSADSRALIPAEGATCPPARTISIMQNGLWCVPRARQPSLDGIAQPRCCYAPNYAMPSLCRGSPSECGTAGCSAVPSDSIAPPQGMRGRVSAWAKQ
jgi:hypothetical protein